MFSVQHQNYSAEECFANANASNNVECVLPSSEIAIIFRSNGTQTRKNCHIYAEKYDYKGFIQLRITEASDRRRMYVATVDTSSFQKLKQDQSLHVTFVGFIDNLLKMLQDALAGKLELCVMQTLHNAEDNSAGDEPMDRTLGNTGGGVSLQLQFYEKRPFKNLIHLCLPIRVAPLNVVLFYMNSLLDDVQSKNSALEHNITGLQHEIDAYNQRAQQYEAEISKLRADMVDNSKHMIERHSTELQKMQESLQRLSEKRQQDMEKHSKIVASMQTQLEDANIEKSQALAEKCQEQKRCEHLNEEIASLKAHICKLKDQNEQQQTEIGALKNLERKNEMHLTDLRKHVGELQEKLKKHEKAKADIIAELQAEKKISQTKRQALEMCTEEISKANEIILRQRQELVKLKKTIDWRTEVALQQEKAVTEKERQLALAEQQIKSLQQTNDSLKLEIPKELESLREYANSLEQRYSEQIKKLRNELKEASKQSLDLL